VLRDVNDLKQQIERIPDTLDAERDASPAAWFWPTMSDQEREAKFGEQYDWVETVLREQYPSYLADHIKPCWPTTPKPDGNSPGSTGSGPSPTSPAGPPPKGAADWHDRWTPGLIRRLSQIMVRCSKPLMRRLVCYRKNVAGRQGLPAGGYVASAHQ
jgi:hypothetical protein